MSDTLVSGIPVNDELTKLKAWELAMILAARNVIETKKHCMLIIRVDGIAWQIFEAEPIKRIVLTTD